MPVIQLKYTINAPIEVCFDLARSIDFHKLSTGNSKEEAIDGTTSGLIELGEFVTWQATHFGVRQNSLPELLKCKGHIILWMKWKGVFKSIWHKHTFTAIESGTLMTDEFRYESPLGILGKLADYLFLERYLKDLLNTRNQMIKDYAESGEWRRILSSAQKTDNN